MRRVWRSDGNESWEHVIIPSRRTDPSGQDLPRELLAVAAVLIGVGSALGLAGLAMGAAALATAGQALVQPGRPDPR
jgi:hypothetical protein